VSQLNINFMRYVFSRFFAVLTVFVAATVSFLSAPVSAQGVNDFVITDFQATYSLTNEDPQGLLTITEKIALQYSGQNQGILRSIPSKYKGTDLKLRIISVEKSIANEESASIQEYQEEPYITYEENGNTVLRIGQAGTYITGGHEYILNYQVENVVSFYDEFDELYWDVNGDEWLQPFENVSVELRSNATRFAPSDSECFTGTFGSISRNCEVVEQTNGLDVTTTERLLPRETLTIVQTYEKGYFSPPGWLEKNRGYVIAAPVVLLQFLVVRSIHKKWLLYGKDPKKRGIVAPYFERPKNISVMQALYVADKKLAPKHMTATLIDLAIRGFVKITEKKVGKKTTHTLELLQLPNEQLQPDESELLKGVFTDIHVGAVIELEKKKYALASTALELQKTVDSITGEKGFFALSPKKSLGKVSLQLFFSGALLFIGFIFSDITSGITVLSGFGALIAAVTYAALMTKRTTQGNMLVEHIEGLKLYLGKAETERIKMQDAVAAPLAKNTGQPERTVEFFEKLLPFAVALGVDETWSDAFKDIYTTPPGWYSGNWNTFTTAALVSSLNTATKVTDQTFTSPSSSGSSGSGGGGFSGGGGGGGGGGGW
jgi:uncharacterized membrane protein YgcG